MKKLTGMKKVLGVAVAMTAAVAMLSGCGSSSTSSDSSDTLSKIISTKKMTVGCILANEPYGSYDEKGNPIGYDVDIAYLLADSLGVSHDNVTFTNTAASARIPALESGQVDVVIGDFTVALDRAQKVEFTDPYDAAAAGVLTTPDKTIEHASELAGKKVGAAKGSTNEDSAEALIDSGVDLKLTLFDGMDEMETALKTGQIDAIIGDTSYCAYKAKTYPDDFAYCVTDSSEMLIPPFYNAIGVRRGDEMWLNYLNKFVFQINTDGENDELYQKWFGTERTISLNPQY